MLLNQVAKWREDSLEKSLESGSSVSFNVIASYSNDLKGFAVHADINGNGGVWVSSQRQEKRVFKTLDALRRAMQSAGIPAFTVVG